MLTLSVEQADHVYGAVVAKKIDESLEQNEVSLAMKQNKRRYETLMS